MNTESHLHMLRHFLATLAYRGRNVLRQMPRDAVNFRPDDSETVRSPIEILNHINQVLCFLQSELSQNQAPMRHDAIEPLDWDTESLRFFDSLVELDRSFAKSTGLIDGQAEKILQGPLADAMLHLGQIGIFRRLAGSPIAAEMYYSAPIEVGKVDYGI